jgi:hypothetical protein
VKGLGEKNPKRLSFLCLQTLKFDCCVQGEEAEKEDAALPAQPAVTLQSAREAAALMARFVAEDASDFEADAEFIFEKKFAGPLSRMMVERLRQRKQGTLDGFLR